MSEDLEDKIVDLWQQYDTTRHDKLLTCTVSKLSTESVGSRRELVANSIHTAVADATQLDS